MYYVKRKYLFTQTSMHNLILATLGTAKQISTSNVNFSLLSVSVSVGVWLIGWYNNALQQKNLQLLPLASFLPLARQPWHHHPWQRQREQLFKPRLCGG